MDLPYQSRLTKHKEEEVSTEAAGKFWFSKQILNNFKNDLIYFTITDKKMQLKDDGVSVFIDNCVIFLDE